MGTADRDYFRDEARRYSGGGGLPSLTSVTKWLLIINISVFVVDWLFLNKELSRRFSFSVQSAVFGGRVWEFLTFQFLHGDPIHLLFNSFGLWFFGRWVEQWWSPRRFLIFYLLCGIGGGVLYTLVILLHILPDGPMVGASAGIYGCLVAVAMIDPKVQVRPLFLPVTFTVKRAAQILLGFATLMVLVALITGTEVYKNTGGEAGHLGGAIAGYALMRFSALLGRRAELEAKIVRPKEFRQKKRKPKPPSKLRPRTHVETATASEVDRILDKINKEGMQSLTAEEQAALKEASESRKDR